MTIDRRTPGAACHIATVLAGCAVLVSTAIAAAASEKSVPLRDVLARARTSPQVELQVRLQLKIAKVSRNDVVCRSRVLDQSWRRLDGNVTGPYECPIGSRVLVLTSKVMYVDAAGARISRSDPALHEKAVAIRETRFRWRWRKA